jgi:uncharacterized protein (TIGR00156 family)
MKNKYIRILLLCCLTMHCLTSTTYAQEKKGKAREYPSTGGFRGPNKAIGSMLVTKTGQIQSTPVSSAKSLSDDTPIMLIGNIILSLGQDLYTFKDSSGEITVRIKQGDWKGLSIEESDSIVIAGYVKYRDDGQIEIDVKVL